MAGRRHHYIPKALLRGFAISAGKASYVWLHRNDGKDPSRTNIINVGMELDFYAETGDQTLDDDITRRESDEFGHVLAGLRAGGEVSPEWLNTLRAFLAHCLIRTANVRVKLSDGYARSIAMLRRFLADQGLMRNLLQGMLDDEERILQTAKEDFSKRGIPISDEQLRTDVKRLIELHKKNLDSETEELTNQLASSMASAIDSRALNARALHLAAFARAGIVPDNFLSRIVAAPFGVQRVTAGSLILGDSIVVGFDTKDPSSARDPLSPARELVGWVLPITSELFAYSGNSVLSALNADAINRASVRSAKQFFVCRDRDCGLRDASSDIGTLRGPIDELDLEGIYQELQRRAAEGTLHKGKT